jgi:hypothetical protein
MRVLRDCESFHVAAPLSSRPARLAIGLMVVALLTLLGCSLKEDFGAPAVLATSPLAAPAPLGVNGAVAPRLHWSACRSSFQCATATVPLDYNNPRGVMITLSVVKLSAADPAHRLGSLFVNFGGPGTGSVSELESLGSTYPDLLRQRFDLLSFDPRGVGGSAPVRCAGHGGAGDEPARPEQRA